MGATRAAADRSTADRGSIVLVAAVASAAAGLLHAAAAGSHADRTALAIAFITVAVVQFGIATALVLTPEGGRARSVSTVLLVAVNLGALAAWAATWTVGIGLIDDLDRAGQVGVADGAAAALAAAAAGIGLATLVGALDPHRALPLAGATALVVAVATVGLVDLVGHDHAHDEGHPDAGTTGHHHGTTHAHGRAEADASSADISGLVRIDPLELVRSGGHRHDAAGLDDAGHERGNDGTDHEHGPGSDAGPAEAHVHEAPAVPPRPYDPALPIDLGGVDGVTLEQQAFAENLVAVTLRYLPQWADPAVAEAAGFRSIGDAVTGHEHYVNWAWIDDDVWMDPTRPESLVFEIGPGGAKVLAAAMYMLPPSMSLDDIPDWGGALMQWHVHEDLCYTADPVAPRVAAVIPIGGDCPTGLVAKDPAPMIHVWIRPHECGPFAALDGIGAGQVAPGEEHRCNHVHGAGEDRS